MKLISRVSKIEQELTVHTKPATASSVPQQSVPEAISEESVFTAKTLYTQPKQFIPQTVQQTYQIPEKSTGSAFMEWLQDDLLMKVGALFLLMGFGWFVSYAFMNDWIGEAGRIALGLLSGASILSLGAWRIKTHEHQGAVFTVLGSTIVILTVFAGRAMYDFFTPASALGLMFLSVLFVAVVSLKYNRNSLALASLILAGIAPYFTVSPTPLVIEQFLYLFVIVSGTLWVVYHTGWRNLTLTALIIVFLETLPFATTQGDSLIVLLWVFLFVAVFFVANVISIIRVNGMALSEAHLFTAFGTALFLIFWVFSVAPDEFQSLLFVVWMLVFSFGAYIVYYATRERAPFYVYGGTSIALLAAATTAELSGAVLNIAYTFEIAVLIIAALLMKLEDRAIVALSSLFAVPMLLSFGNMGSRTWNSGILHEDFFVLLILTLVLLILGIFLFERSRSEEYRNETLQKTGVFFTVCGVAYIFVLTSLVNTGLFSSVLLPIATAKGAILTIVYTLEIATILSIACGMRCSQKTIVTLSYLFAMPILLSFAHIASPAWESGIMHADFLALLVLTAALAFEGFRIYKYALVHSGNDTSQHTGVTFMLASILYLLVLIWLVAHGLFTEDIASMIALTIYTVIGLFFFFKGKKTDVHYMVTTGGILVGFVVVRLLLIDVWAMALFGRIITFLVIGGLLISTAFMGKKNKDII